MARFPHVYVLNVMADDRPGIVAAVAGAVAKLGGSIDECSQTVLNGYFTLIMIVSLPGPTGPATLADTVRSAERNLQVMACPFAELPSPAPGAEKFVITAFGHDQPGIVLRFSQYLAGKDINITDFYADRKHADFVLISQVEIPPQWDLALLQADLEELGNEMGFTVRLQHENIFVATNQLRLTVGRTNATNT